VHHGRSAFLCRKQFWTGKAILDKDKGGISAALYRLS